MPAAGSGVVHEPTELFNLFELLALYCAPISTISGRLYSKS